MTLLHDESCGADDCVWEYNALDFTYDGLDNSLSETANSGLSPTSIPTPATTYHVLQYTYDTNGRRTSMAASLNGVALPNTNYGYDCADELVSMSNNGTSLTSCAPSTFVGYNGNTSTQVALNYDADGAPANTLVDGVQTIFSRDADERPTSESFQTYPGGSSYGMLTYQYDADGRLVDKGGSLAAVNLPANEAATYSTTDQLATWNTHATTVDKADNLLTDPSTSLTYTWNARNQLSAISGGVSETYDVLGRRESSTKGGT